MIKWIIIIFKNHCMFLSYFRTSESSIKLVENKVIETFFFGCKPNVIATIRIPRIKFGRHTRSRTRVNSFGENHVTNYTMHLFSSFVISSLNQITNLLPLFLTAFHFLSSFSLINPFVSI